jgi:acyl-CoA hydrolase/RimJ/RimL family protein N-acetyltransferase
MNADTDDWRSAAKTLTAAIEVIKRGDRVFVGTGCATPLGLLHELESMRRPPPGVQLIHFLLDGELPDGYPEGQSHYQHKVFFVAQNCRGLLQKNRAEYVPVSLSDVPELIRSARIPVDVAMVQVSPPDKGGMCSMGVSVDATRAALDRADRVIAEINPAMPRTCGDTLVPLARFDAFVAVDSPVTEYVHAPVGDVAEHIARYVARVISDGSTLQIGLGRVPNEMLRYLKNRRDLGIHSDVITEPLVDLYEAGVVTGARKSFDQWKVVASWAMGTRRLYDLIDGNPAFELRPIDRVCDSHVIAAHDQMVSVTQAFAVDLTGQVCADEFGGELYGGVATQPEFHRGTSRSRGGKAIVCLMSTTDDGASRILPRLREGEGVAIARDDTQYVVTEYGVAYLFGKTLRERAVALIEIAHPDHREKLFEQAVALGFMGQARALKSRRAYPTDSERHVTLRNGQTVLLRPARTTDAAALHDLFFRLPPKDVFTRFFINLASLSEETAHHMCSVDYENEMAYVAVTGEDWESERVIGTAAYYVDPARNMADVAYMVDPEWQGCGLGGALQDVIIEYAKAQGLRGFTADVLKQNVGMIKVFERSGCRVTRHLEDDAYEVQILFEEA